MPRARDHETQRGAVVSAAADLICEGGLAAASLRAVARRSRVSPSLLVENWGGRDRMLFLVTAHFGREWQKDLFGRALRDGVTAFVPQTQDELDDVRVWLALCELGRNHEQVGMEVAGLRANERDLLVGFTRRALPDVDHDVLRARVDLLQAVLDGIRHGLCTPGTSLTVETARTTLDALLAHVRAPGPGTPPACGPGPASWPAPSTRGSAPS